MFSCSAAEEVPAAVAVAEEGEGTVSILPALCALCTGIMAWPVATACALGQRLEVRLHSASVAITSIVSDRHFPLR